MIENGYWYETFCKFQCMPLFQNEEVQFHSKIVLQLPEVHLQARAVKGDDKIVNIIEKM